MIVPNHKLKLFEDFQLNKRLKALSADLVKIVLRNNHSVILLYCNKSGKNGKWENPKCQPKLMVVVGRDGWLSVCARTCACACATFAK